EDVVFGHDHQLFAVELDLGAGVAGEDDLVALLDVERGALAVVEATAFADGQDLAALGLFLGAVGEDDAALGLALGLDALDEDLVTERTQFCHDWDSFEKETKTLSMFARIRDIPNLGSQLSDLGFTSRRATGPGDIS